MKRKLPLVLLALLILSAAVILIKPGPNYAVQDRDSAMASSSRRHWAGTDDLGRDRLVRTAAALLIGISCAAAASAVTTSIAATVGTLAAFSPGILGSGLMLLSDVFLTLPWLFLLMIVRSMLPLTTSPVQSVAVTFLILAALGWPACARAVYRGALGLRSSEWMLHTRASGLRTSQVLRRHLLPRLRSLLIPQFLLCIPAFLVAEANLGALGLGIAEPLPSWGGMLLESDNSALLARTGWVYLPVGLLVMVLLLLEISPCEV